MGTPGVKFLESLNKTACLSLLLLVISLLTVGVVSAPAGSVDPREILLQHFGAVGGLERVKAERTSYLSGRITHDRLEGRVQQWGQVPLRFRVEQDYTVVQLAHGDDGSRSWSQDVNGQVIAQRDEETLKRRRIRLLLQNFDHMDPDTQTFSLSYEGTEPVGGVACHVIRTTNRINDDITLDYLNTRTLLLEKSTLQQPDMTFHTRYSDYRDVNGVLHAFREETDILPAEKKITLEIDTYQTHLAIDPSRFAIPAAEASDFQFIDLDRSENIPFKLVENMIFLPVTIADDTRLWILDNAATQSVIDREYAVHLGLEIHPGVQGSGLDGTFRLDFVALPGYRLPGVRFGPQKIFCYQGLAEKFHEPHAVGILGFDFLSRVVARIDYASSSLSLYDPQKFVYSGPGTLVDSPLQGKTFTLPMTVEGRYGGKWALDLGSHNASFHFPFAQEHELVKRHGVNRASADLSGAYLEHVVNFRFVELPGFRVDNVLIGIPEREGKGGNTARELIGNIGNSLLRRFVVFLDYRRQQVILEKGRDFKRLFPRDGSGLVIGLSENDRPMVSYVAAGTPAERAGFLAGDLIQGIDGFDEETISSAVAIRTLLREPPGTRYRIEVLRNGRPVKLGLTLEALY